MRSPFSEDVAVHELAEHLGFEIVRSRRAIEVVDEKALIAAGFIAKKPKLDYPRIAHALESGDLPGARWSSFEYVLRPAEVSQ